NELYALMCRAAPYATLARADFDAVLELVSEGVVTGRGARAAYLHRDRVNERLRGRRGARLSALTSGGAIPETADYRVVAEPDDTFIGTINEDFAIESMAGDVFLLGSTSWRIRRVERGTVRVVDAQGAAPSVPFWLGEAPARTAELSLEVSELRHEVDRLLAERGPAAAEQWLVAQAGISDVAAREVVAYFAAARGALGLLPSQRDLVFERFFDESGGMQLVVHAPFGGRVNRGLGLLLRKRFCTSFDFELQAAANDDAIVLSLGPQHSFPLEAVPDFLAPRRVREALINAVIVTPMFTARWRWNLTRALVVLRFKKGRKNPPALQRMESDDVMVAVFPALAACQDNATGPREIPDHPLVRQTLHDCLHEAMDVEGLERVLEAIASGQLNVHFRDTTEPSPLAHEILNSRPYTFLDDAPLEERRTRAVQLRRGLPVEARALANLDAEAVARVRAEAKPEPRTADELHDLLLGLGVFRPSAAWRDWFADLVASGRAFELELGSDTLWCARESRGAVDVLFPTGRCVPDLPLPEALAGPAPELEVAARNVVRGHLETLGPVDVAELSALTALSEATVKVALARLEGEGFALRGSFTAEEQYCARRLLARIHAYTQVRLRREIEPVTARDFMRFLLRWQHVQPEARLSGQRGLSTVLEQLQGFEAAVGVWESELLKARLESYRSEWLDQLCLSGQLTWARLSLPALRADTAQGASLSRATPIALAFRQDLPWLLAAARGDAAPAEPIQAESACLLAYLRQQGASFFSEIMLHSGLSQEQLQDALWDAVARGFVTSDGFQTLRALLISGSRWAPTSAPARSRLRKGSGGAPSGEGRWAILPNCSQIDDREALAEAVAEQMLMRWGVLFRDLYMVEELTLPWREVAWALRRLEARGSIRGGRFVNGFAGEQYALPDAVEMLRTVRRSALDGSLVRVSACDPLNLVGVVLPGARVHAVRTNFVTYRDGELVMPADGAVSTQQSISTPGA
ncbi:MAG TPA: hypothetical protein VER33_03175, partial [Polyangiaceae bacterium]|nr:hypothetical protein [Polyangiaceae bacterium]